NCGLVGRVRRAGGVGGADVEDAAGDGAATASPVGLALRVAHPSRGAFSPMKASTWATASWPQGAHFVAGEGSALQVGVYSAHATRILLEIYPSATGSSAIYDYWLAKGPDDIWRAEVAAVPGKTLYAF